MKKKFFLLYLTVFSIFFIVGCSKKENSISLTEVFDNGTLQTRGTYILKEGNLSIEKEFTLSTNPNTLPGDIDLEQEKKEINQMIKHEFPKESASDELFQTFKTQIKGVQLKKEKNGFVMQNKKYKKEFRYVNDAKSRVTDELGIEYSIEK